MTAPIDWEAMAAASAWGAAQAKTARIIATVTCSTPTCPRRGQWHQIHDGAVTPVLCGSCAAPLHCDHSQQATRTVYEGTLAAPIAVNIDHCAQCATEFGRRTQPVSLDQIPIAALMGEKH